MARYTDRWGLSILGSGDSLQDEGFKYTDADIRLIDRVLAYAAETHRHTGDLGVNRTPDAGLNIMLLTSGGAMASGGRFYYRYTVVDVEGNESAGSPIQSVDMPLATSSPQAPSPTAVTGTGDLLPGTYSYVFSAYKDAESLETKAVNSAAIRIPGSDPNNSVSMVLPDLPLGASGLNAYRKSPSGMHYLYITSVAAPDSGDVWVDDGSIEGDCDRSLPPLNRTSNSNAVSIVYPGATPSVPDGWSWNIYRSENPSDWGRSFLTSVSPEGATPSTPVSFVDVGGGTQMGGPPNQAQLITAPPKINLTDAAEVQGTLPPGLVTVPLMITFSAAGPVTETEGSFTWVCDFEQVDIISCRAYLGVDSVPAAQDVIIDVNAYRFSQATPTWMSIFEDGPDRPKVLIGENVGVASVPTIQHLELGDALCVDVDQAGGGATPTDANLTVNVLMYTKTGSETESYQWA